MSRPAASAACLIARFSRINYDRKDKMLARSHGRVVHALNAHHADAVLFIAFDPYASQ